MAPRYNLRNGIRFKYLTINIVCYPLKQSSETWLNKVCSTLNLNYISGFEENICTDNDNTPNRITNHHDQPKKQPPIIHHVTSRPINTKQKTSKYSIWHYVDTTTPTSGLGNPLQVAGARLGGTASQSVYASIGALPMYIVISVWLILCEIDRFIVRLR